MTAIRAQGITLDEAAAALRRIQDAPSALRQAYDLLSSRYHGERFATLTHFFELFRRDPYKLWGRTGFMHCTNINRLLRFLLVASGRFSEEQIENRWTLLWFFSPHQYLRVWIGEGWTAVDVWAKAYGIAFGDHAHGFHVGSAPQENKNRS